MEKWRRLLLCAIVIVLITFSGQPGRFCSVNAGKRNLGRTTNSLNEMLKGTETDTLPWVLFFVFRRSRLQVMAAAVITDFYCFRMAASSCRNTKGLVIFGTFFNTIFNINMLRRVFLSHLRMACASLPLYIEPAPNPSFPTSILDVSRK